jgi:hypothetical protein
MEIRRAALGCYPSAPTLTLLYTARFQVQIRTNVPIAEIQYSHYRLELTFVQMPETRQVRMRSIVCEVFMLRFSAFCLTLVAVLFVLVDVCDIHPTAMTARSLAMDIRSLVVAVKH